MQDYACPVLRDFVLKSVWHYPISCTKIGVSCGYPIVRKVIDEESSATIRTPGCDHDVSC